VLRRCQATALVLGRLQPSLSSNKLTSPRQWGLSWGFADVPRRLGEAHFATRHHHNQAAEYAGGAPAGGKSAPASDPVAGVVRHEAIRCKSAYRERPALFGAPPQAALPRQPRETPVERDALAASWWTIEGSSGRRTT
jgi:hypothetical protein